MHNYKISSEFDKKKKKKHSHDSILKEEFFSKIVFKNLDKIYSPYIIY